MTILKYGEYSHPLTPEVRMSEGRVGAPDGVRQARKRVWEIAGLLVYNGSGDTIAEQIEDLVAAYATDGNDLVLYADNGVTVLDQLDSSDAAGGTKVTTRPEFPVGRGAEYATVRHYRVVVEALFIEAAALASNAWGTVVTTTRLQPDGTYMLTVAGEFHGKALGDAQAAADAQKLSTGYVVVEETQTPNVDERKVAFSYQYLDSDSGREVIAFAEQTSVREAFTRVAFRESLDGAAAVKQTTSQMPAYAYQSGSAAGRTTWPDFPAYKFLEGNLAEPPAKIKHSPRRLAGGLTEYRIDWSYVFAFAETPDYVNPGTPPDGSDQPT